MTVLIVDDDQAVRDVLVRVLTEEGCVTATARNGKEALAYLAAAESLPQLILLDMMMPVMNGAQCWQALKSHPEWKTIPVMMLSAGIYLQQTADFLSIEALIAKPIDFARLRVLVRPFCNPSQSRTTE